MEGASDARAVGGIACVLVKCWMVEGVCDGSDDDGVGACDGVGAGAGVGGRLVPLGERRAPASLGAGGRLEPGLWVWPRPAAPDSLLARGRADDGISGGGEDTPDSLKTRRWW